MPINTARLRDNIAALADLKFEAAQIRDGRVTNPEAAATILQAVQVHVKGLLASVPRPTPARLPPSVSDTASMTDAELYAYYKRTALLEDLRFLLRCRMSEALRAQAEAITKPTAQNLVRLRAAWRAERNAEDRANGIPAIGTVEWHRQTFGEPPEPAVSVAMVA